MGAVTPTVRPSLRHAAVKWRVNHPAASPPNLFQVSWFFGRWAAPGATVSGFASELLLGLAIEIQDNLVG